MPAEFTDVKLHLAVFDGPLDLLLHLIRVNELDIYDIPIAEITRQYDGYLNLMENLDLQVAGEYLVMAATLVHIKSRMLLPKPPTGEVEEEDPRAGLVRQLVEYERFKLAADGLRALQDAREEVFERAGDPLAPFEGESLLSVSLFDLLAAFRRVLDTASSARAIEIAREELSVAEKVEWIQMSLRARGAVVFQELLKGLSGRAEMVVTFLALLELIRIGRVQAAQRGPAGEILLMLRQGDRAVSGSQALEAGDDDVGHS